MRCARWIAGLVVVVVVAACGFPRPKQADAIDAAPEVSGDADPCALDLSEITPQVIDEGQGTGGSAPAVLVIRGNHIVNANLAVELKAHDGTTAVQLTPVAGALASSDHAYLAFTVTAPVDSKLGNIAATDVPLDVTVRQDAPLDGSCAGAAAQTLSGQLVLRVLPELTNPQVTTAALYSRIELGNLDWSGLGLAEPLALNAVSSITLGSVSVSSSGARSGPGGYSAGATPGPGAGGDGGNVSGINLASGGGGGGAGFAIAGKAGDAGGATAGTAGTVTGEDLILSVDKNRASAGGKGGGGVAVLGGPLAPGGAGGGGGGFLLLTAGGDITTADVFAGGGDGADSGGAGGGGGAGAGGTVVARSGNGKLVLGMVRVPAGSPGVPGGGSASVGRVRWDSPLGEAPTSPDHAAHRGPSFLDPARMVTAREPVFTLIGSPNDEIDIDVSGDGGASRDVGHIRVPGSGTAMITPQLFPGYNQLCAKLSGAAASESVARACIDVAFLP